MNLLQLAQAVKRESGLAGGGPTAFATASGDDARIFHWVIGAWREIDLMHEAWGWRRASATAPTNGTTALAVSDFGMADFGAWKRASRDYGVSAWRTADGVACEQQLAWMPYETFRRAYLLGAHQAAGLQHWSLTPGGDLLVGPTPDADHTVRADYIRDHTALAADADVPALPSRFHMLIVWEALLQYGGYDAASEVAQRARRNADALWGPLSQDQLPAVGWGARPLA